MNPRRDPTDWTTALAAGLMVCLAAGCSRAPGAGEAASGPVREMVSVLATPSSHPSLGDRAQDWDHFVGTWDTDFTFYLGDGSVSHATGELLFGWVLDGRAIQDIWISYPRDGTKERNIGTSIRFFDEETKTWRVVFVAPAYGGLLTVKGGVEGDRIVLRGTDDEGDAIRWSFNDIHADSFIWRGERSRDGGRTWTLEEEHHMRRRAATR